MIIPNTFKLSKKVLTKVATPVNFDNPQLNRTLANRMLEFMQQQGGIGLAAPQVGISKRVFVMQIDRLATFCFNPEIISVSEETMPFEEGCLSFPGEQLTTKRPRSIEVRYQDHSGVWINGQFSGLASVCFQHELDHLNGVVFHERA